MIVAADQVSEALSGISGALEWPVHAAALLLLGVLAYELGRVGIEAWRRVRPGAHAQGVAARSHLAERTVLAIDAGDDVEHALGDFELHVQRRLDRTRMLVRAGPALGLMGTLIPLAPGLVALGEGDFQVLAGDLKVAFAATVIGILVGTAAFGLTLYRTRIYTEDLAALERAVQAR
jgi:biopolymer transport protein ExbB/TolQ